MNHREYRVVVIKSGKFSDSNRDSRLLEVKLNDGWGIERVNTIQDTIVYVLYKIALSKESDSDNRRYWKQVMEELHQQRPNATVIINGTLPLQGVYHI